MRTGGIGFFDSGVGGLSVLRSCLCEIRGFPIYYYGDNLHAPYGNLDIYDMRAYVREAFDLFSRLQVAAVVIACNTVTTCLIEELRGEYPFPILGIEPAILPAAMTGGSVLVLCTKATSRSARLKELIQKAKEECVGVEVFVAACENLALMVERGWLDGKIDLSKELPPIKAENVVLGCTHYSLIKDEIEAFYQARIFEGNEGVANRLKSILQNQAENIEKIGKTDHLEDFFQMLRDLSFSGRKNRRKKSRFRLKKIGCSWKLKNAQSFYFIGSGRILNCKFYERMFGF